MPPAWRRQQVLGELLPDRDHVVGYRVFYWLVGVATQMLSPSHSPSLLTGIGRAFLAAASTQLGGRTPCCRPFSAAAETPPPTTGAAAEGAEPDARGGDEQRAASLPVEQAAKALLAGNARGQLTSVRADGAAAEESKVYSSVVGYVCPRGEAPVLLLSPEDVQHLRNIEENPKVGGGWGGLSAAQRWLDPLPPTPAPSCV